MLWVAEVPASVGTRAAWLQLDPQQFAPERLQPGQLHGGLSITASLRLDGELAERLRLVFAESATGAPAVPMPAGPLAAASDWELLATTDPRTQAERLVWAAAAQFVRRWRDGGGRLWDPRLEGIAAATAVMAEQWRCHGVPLAVASKPQLADAVAAALRLPMTSASAYAYQRLGGFAAPRFMAPRAALLVIARRCEEVADHALGIVSRTLDPAIAARYRALAQDCGAIAAAVAALGRR